MYMHVHVHVCNALKYGNLTGPLPMARTVVDNTYSIYQSTNLDYTCFTTWYKGLLYGEHTVIEHWKKFESFDFPSSDVANATFD